MSLLMCWTRVSNFKLHVFCDLGFIRLAQDESDWAIVDAEAESYRVAEGAAQAAREVDGAF